jgi:hypothetical protein
MIDGPPMLGSHDRQTGHNMPCAYDAVRFYSLAKDIFRNKIGDYYS